MEAGSGGGGGVLGIKNIPRGRSEYNTAFTLVSFSLQQVTLLPQLGKSSRKCQGHFCIWYG